MRRELKVTLILIIAGLLAFGAYYLGLLLTGHNPFLNFGEVVPGELYRSGDLGPSDLEKIVKKYGVKTVVCLKGEEKSELKEKAQELGLNLVGVQARANRPAGPETMGFLTRIISGQSFDRKEFNWLIKDWLGPGQDQVRLAGPYLIHCQMGADRSGYLVAVYRICFQGWSAESARMEMLRYYHFPPRFPRLWQELKKMDAQEFCPGINPEYQSISAGN